MSIFTNKPEDFFNLVTYNLDQNPSLIGASAGYEAKQFRHDDLADYLMEWLPEFTMKYSDLEEFNSGTSMRLIKKAARTVYTTEKYARRGEFGELLLHALLREVFNSEPAISKIFYKSAMNETVKGFDAVHIVEADDGLELWLGEVKFYKNATQAIADICPEIVDHTQYDYLRDEFILIGSKIDPKWEHSESVQALINSRKSLDEVFKRISIPALITYESKCVTSYEQACDEFHTKLKEEMSSIYQKFIGKELPEVRIHLFLVPLGDKKNLVEILHSKLEGLQR